MRAVEPSCGVCVCLEMHEVRVRYVSCWTLLWRPLLTTILYRSTLTQSSFTNSGLTRPKLRRDRPGQHFFFTLAHVIWLFAFVAVCHCLNAAGWLHQPVAVSFWISWRLLFCSWLKPVVMCRMSIHTFRARDMFIRSVINDCTWQPGLAVMTCVA